MVFSLVLSQLDELCHKYKLKQYHRMAAQLPNKEPEMQFLSNKLMQACLRKRLISRHDEKALSNLVQRAKPANGRQMDS